MERFLNSIEIGSFGQKTMPSEAYLSEDIFHRETKQLFKRNWLCVAREHELVDVGSFRVREIANESIILVRDQKNQVQAHINLCRHRGTRLCEETRGNFGKSIQCPYHAWTYSLDGRLIGVPDENQIVDFCRDAYPLHSVSCATWEGFVWINLAESPETFDTTFAPILNKFSAWNLSTLISQGQKEYDVAANWKLLVQNFSECYHCAPLHPALVKISSPKSGGNDLIEGPFLGGFMEITRTGGSLTMSGRSCAPTLGNLKSADLQRVYFYVLFPNMFFSLHHDYVMVHTLWPQSPTKTRVECQWLFHPETIVDSHWDPQDAISFWDQTNQEDWHASELTQKGMNSDYYVPGPYSNREAMSAAFDREYIKAMR